MQAVKQTKCEQCGRFIDLDWARLCDYCNEKENESRDERARYRAAAESCGRDDIRVVVEYRSMYAGVHSGHVELNVFTTLDSDPCNWYDQALRLVARVHRLRELLRQAGECI